MSDVSILIIDDDASSQWALREILDSEGWQVKIAPLASEALRDLATREWTLVLVNVALADLAGPLFTTLKELAHAEAQEGEARRARVLFVVPQLLAMDAQPLLEKERLPFVLKPFHLHDFLEKVGDLLIEAGAISQPLRQVHLDLDGVERRRRNRRTAGDRRHTSHPMFAGRDDYQMTEEEIAEYERLEEEERKKKKEKKDDDQERLI